MLDRPLSLEPGDHGTHTVKVDKPAEQKTNGHAKPHLKINSGDLPSTAKELARFFAADDHFLSNGNTPVMIVTGDDIPRAVVATADLVRTAAHDLCQPVKEIKGKWIHQTLSKDLAQLYLYGLVGEWGLKIFRGITTAPILKDDGTVRVARGYDAETGLWCHNIPNLKLPARPDEEEARQALGRLQFSLPDFPVCRQQSNKGRQSGNHGPLEAPRLGREYFSGCPSYRRHSLVA